MWGPRSGFAQDPGGHAAAALDDGGFEGIDQFGVSLASEGEEHGFIDKEPPGGSDAVDAVAERLEVHADAGGETAEEESAGTQYAPEFAEHGVEVLAGAGKVQDGATEDDVGDGVGEWHLLDGSDAEVLRGCWVREITYLVHSLGIGVDGEYFGALAQQVDEIASGAAACVEDAHGGRDVAAKNLIEEIDVDLSELFLKSHAQSLPR
jgi:hypothetical protein